MIQTPAISIRGALFVETADGAFEEIPHATSAEVGVSGALTIYAPDGVRLYAPGYWLNVHPD